MDEMIVEGGGERIWKMDERVVEGGGERILKKDAKGFGRGTKGCGRRRRKHVERGCKSQGRRGPFQLGNSRIQVGSTVCPQSPFGVLKNCGANKLN
jgi:hypothetical protein